MNALKMLFSKNKNTAPLVNVEVNIIALLKDQYVNEVLTVAVPQGVSIKQLLKIAHSQNLLDKDIFKFVKKLRPPISLIVNGTNVAKNKTSQYSAAKDDQITIFTPLSGG